MPPLEDFKPFLITGLALGGVYAVSGVGMVVLYRTTGVLNLAFGAVGAMGAFIAWTLIDKTTCPTWLAYLACIGFGGVVTLAYGVVFGPALADREPLAKATATLGLALILLGAMSWIWSDKARSLDLSTSSHSFQISGTFVTWTQVIALLLAIAVTAGTLAFMKYTKVGTAMRALANDREIAATLGVPVRRVEAAAWLGSGLLSGATGLLLANLIGLDATTLTFLVISALAATLIARLRSVTVTLVAGLVVGLVDALVTPILSISQYRDMTPFVLATVALLYLSRKDIRVTGVR
jgi:branched-chain amino acid transport system permease protein